MARWRACTLLAFVGALGHAAVVNDESTCQRVGAPAKGKLQVVGCDWYRNVLENRNNLNSSCEPSQEWLIASGLMGSENGTASDDLELCLDGLDVPCAYTAEQKCLTAQKDGSCYTPPLELLRGYLESLVGSFPRLFEATETFARQCATTRDNVTCNAQQACVWNPTNLSKTRPGFEDEVQTVSVFQEVAPEPQLQFVELRATEFDDRIVTLSLLSRNVDSIDLAASRFRLVYSGRETEAIAVNAGAADIRNALTKLGTLNSGFSVSVTSRTSTNRPTSWEIKFDGSSAQAQELSLGRFHIEHISGAPKEDEWPPSMKSIMLTRHRHNQQRVTIWSNAEVRAGEFILVYKSMDPLTSAINDRETRRLSFNATSDEVRDALLALISSGSQALSYVAVTVASTEDLAEDFAEDPTGAGVSDSFPEMEGSGAIDALSGLAPWRSWDITFAALVQEYEHGEFLLLPKYKGAPVGLECKGCEEFDVPFTTLRTESLVKAPKILGTFQMDMCRFSRALPGRAFPEFNSTRVEFDLLPPSIALPMRSQDFVGPGAFVKIAGSVYQVVAVDLESPWLELATPFGAVVVPSSIPGVSAHICAPPVWIPSESGLSAHASGPDFADYVSLKYPGLQPNVTVEAPANALNEMTWVVSLHNPVNTLDLLRFSVLDELGWTVHVAAMSPGVAPVSGSFRLAFAGYMGNVSDFEALPLAGGVADPNANLAGQVVFDNHTIQFTRPIPFDASAEEMRAALLELSSIAPSGVSVSRSDVVREFALVEGDLEWRPLEPGTETNASVVAVLAGRAWSVTFSAKEIAGMFSPEELETLTADVPQLAVADSALLQGTLAQVMVETVLQGTGNLTQSNVTEFVLDEASDNSPCVVNETFRDNVILDELGIDRVKLQALQELDANMKRCAGGIDAGKVWHDAAQCRRVRFSPDRDPNNRNDYNEDGTTSPPLSGGSSASNNQLGSGSKSADSGAGSPTSGTGDGSAESDGEAPVQPEDETFCVWRGEGKLREGLPSNVDPDQVVAFNWVNVSYGGTSGFTRNAECTVPLIYQSQQLLKLYGVSAEFVEAYSALNETTRPMLDVHVNTNASAQLSVLIEQFNQCYEDVQTYIQVPVPELIKLWQRIVSFTCYTVCLWYAVASIFFAYRMRKLHILSPKSAGSVLLVVIGGACFGFVLGFVLGCFPAWILANIFGAIPHNLPFASALSLGIAQGVLIIYFDMGRAITTQPTKID